jgi:TRAP-type C4-dicarboxylate transport system permease small subunit
VRRSGDRPIVIERILSVWSRIETTLIGILVLCSLAVFLGGAVVRALAPQHAVDWAEEVSLYFIIWATVLSGSVLAAEGRHINTEIVTGALPPTPRKVVTAAMLLLTLGFCVAMTVYGWQAFRFALMLDERSGSSLRTPQGWAVFLALPVGMALIVARICLLAVTGRGITPTDQPQPPARGE